VLGKANYYRCTVTYRSLSTWRFWQDFGCGCLIT